MIRIANIKDVTSISQVHVRSWQVAYKGLLPDAVLDKLSVESRQKGWNNILSDPEQYTTIYEENGSITGFCNSGASRDPDASADTGELNAIYLEPDYFHQGIGRQLLLDSLDKLTEKGYKSVSLWVLSSNKKALAFYRHHGFSFDGNEKTAKRPGYQLHEVRMVKTLSFIQ